MFDNEFGTTEKKLRQTDGTGIKLMLVRRVV